MIPDVSDLTSHPNARTRPWLLPVVLMLLLALLLWGAWRSGWLERLRDVRSLVRTIADAGPRGMLAFVVAFTLLQPFAVPGTLFIVAAPLIWPWQVAFGLSLTGTMAASVVGFSFARWVARDWVLARIPGRLRRYEEALARRPFRTVLVLRLVLWMPPPLHAFFGVSRITQAVHFWGSLLGYIPPLLVVSGLGSQVLDADLRPQPMAGPVMLGMTFFSVLVLLVARWMERREQPRATETNKTSSSTSIIAE